MEKLMEPLISRNIELSNETPQEKSERMKRQLGLFHGPGKRKKKKQKGKKK
jgi:hypothetical protein